MKNIDLVLRAMAETALESKQNHRKASSNGFVISQLYTTVQAAALSKHANRHNKNYVDEIFDRSTLIQKPSKEETVSEAAKTLAKQSKKARVAK